jgi:Tol biopolymer transport system component
MRTLCIAGAGWTMRQFGDTIAGVTGEVFMRGSIGRVIVAMGAAGVLANLAPAAAQATFPGAVGKIAISACGSVDCGVFLVDPAGSGGTQLTHNPYLIPVPRGNPYPAPDSPRSWTPDGSRITYSRANVTDGESRIVNADGTQDQAFSVAPPTQFTFSPDGSKLAYVDYEPSGYPQIFVKNVDGGGVTQLTHGEGPGSGRYDPDWSPDGTKIAFTGPGPGTDIHVMNADGSNHMRLLNSVTMSGWDPSWSPDGTKIAFTSTFQGGNYEIFVANSDGSGTPVNLTDNYVGPPDYTRIDDEQPAWSPDGTQIAFTRRVGNPIDLLVMNADGSGVHQLPTGSGANISPVWQSIRGPRRGDYKNASHFCKAERQFWGAEAFRERYGGGHGQCVSRN